MMSNDDHDDNDDDDDMYDSAFAGFSVSNEKTFDKMEVNRCPIGGD